MEHEVENNRFYAAQNMKTYISYMERCAYLVWILTSYLLSLNDSVSFRSVCEYIWYSFSSKITTVFRMIIL